MLSKVDQRWVRVRWTSLLSQDERNNEREERQTERKDKKKRRETNKREVKRNNPCPLFTSLFVLMLDNKAGFYGKKLYIDAEKTGLGEGVGPKVWSGLFGFSVSGEREKNRA